MFELILRNFKFTNFSIVLEIYSHWYELNKRVSRQINSFEMFWMFVFLKLWYFNELSSGSSNGSSWICLWASQSSFAVWLKFDELWLFPFLKRGQFMVFQKMLFIDNSDLQMKLPILKKSISYSYSPIFICRILNPEYSPIQSKIYLFFSV
jgi:hypothetical protein